MTRGEGFAKSPFSNSKIGTLARYPEVTGPARKGGGDLMIENTCLAAMDSGLEHDFIFNEAISLVVSYKTQDEIDCYWEKLSSDSSAEQCGWLKDKYGVSWQIVPAVLGELMKSKEPEKSERVMKTLLQMKKMDIKKLQEAKDLRGSGGFGKLQSLRY